MCFLFFLFFKKKVKIINIYLGCILFLNILSPFMTNIWYCKCLLQLSGEIKLNPGRKPISYKSFSICHWNSNSITSHNFIEVSLLTVYNSIHKFDIICLSEAYLISKHFRLTKIWMYQVITLLELTFCQTPSMREFASTSRN